MLSEAIPKRNVSGVSFDALQVEYVLVVGVGGGVPHYTDYARHVRLGDVVLAAPAPDLPDKVNNEVVHSVHFVSTIDHLRGAADKSAAQVLRKERKTPKEIFEDMVSVLQESAPSYTMVKNGLAYFNKDESCEDDPRPGRPVTVVMEENVRKIEKLVLADRRIKLWQIAEELQISKERVGEIIHEHMNMRKISARWVPKMLTPFDKQRRLQTSKDFLELVGDNIDEICDRIVTVDETWVRQYDPNLNRSPCNGRKRRKAAEEIQGSKSASKLMATIFGIVKSYRSDVGSYRAECCFLQDNASVHTARVSRQALKDTGFSEINHPPYSPDLAPSDYFLFSNIKKQLRGRRFVDDNQMKMAVESHFDCKEKEYFLGGLKAYVYVFCEKAAHNESGGWDFEIKPYKPADWRLQDIAARLHAQYGVTKSSDAPWNKYVEEGLQRLRGVPGRWEPPGDASDRLCVEVGEGAYIEVAHPAPLNDQLDGGKITNEEKGRGSGVRVWCAPVGGGRAAACAGEARLAFAARTRVLAYDCELDAVLDSVVGNRKDCFICVRGISDYRDGTRGKEWQPHAALSAAAVAKALICAMDPPAD
ncbi:Histone-lysine N-methyltransferase SETMAR [Eumeta japonica]|uniref:Histone-lysine N-methyltransferase SETMAR n=1 Tax=Eumeta variegata TaxID=151549 RepID=A0A4C1VM66_EUMVA|nr:Histone-lysine N-methyltransferase SETMAR [Eumeta japonica]